MTSSFIRGQILEAEDLNLEFSRHVDKRGDTMSGVLTLSGNPTGVNDAATKAYVDGQVTAHVAAVQSVAGKIGNVTLDHNDITDWPYQAATSSKKLNTNILDSNATGVLIPAYVYPNNPYSDPTYQAFLQLIRQYHNQVPVIAVLNPGTGPGTVWDGNIAAAIRMLQSAGASVIGYVSTAYGVRDPNLVRADVATWGTLYSTTPIDGIFYDEMPYDPGTGNAMVTLYQNYYYTAKSAGYNIVVGNPGTNQQGVWYAADPPTADIIVTWETAAYPVESDLQGNFVGGHSDYSWKRNSVLIHSQTFNSLAFQMMKKYAKWLWVTDDLLSPNPWDTFPTYMASIFAACVASPGSGRNIIHNATFRIAQRGVGPFTTNNVYTVDQWQMSFVLDTMSVQQSAITDAGRTAIGDEEAAFILQNTFTGNAGATAFNQLVQKIENVRRLAGKTVTVSFWANAAAGTPKLGVSIDQYFGTGGSPSAQVNGNGQSVTLSTTWTRYSLTFAVPTIIGKTLGTSGTDATNLNFWCSAGANTATRAGTPGVQSGTISLWGVQVEVGGNMSPLEKVDPKNDLELCQRFYQTHIGLDIYGYMSAGGSILLDFSLPVQMRAGSPTVVISNTSYTNASAAAGNSYASPSHLRFAATATALGAAQAIFDITVSSEL